MQEIQKVLAEEQRDANSCSSQESSSGFSTSSTISCSTSGIDSSSSSTGSASRRATPSPSGCHDKWLGIEAEGIQMLVVSDFLNCSPQSADVSHVDTSIAGKPDSR